MHSSDQTVLVSDQVLNDLRQADIPVPPNVTQVLSEDVDIVAVYFYESMRIPGQWWVNEINSAPDWFGPYEVNLNYYAFWRSDDRILVAPIEQAREIEFLILE